MEESLFTRLRKGYFSFFLFNFFSSAVLVNGFYSCVAKNSVVLFLEYRLSYTLIEFCAFFSNDVCIEYSFECVLP